MKIQVKEYMTQTEDVRKIINRSPIVMRRYAYYPFSAGEQSGTIEYNDKRGRRNFIISNNF